MPGALQDSPLEDHPHGGGSWEEMEKHLLGSGARMALLGLGSRKSLENRQEAMSKHRVWKRTIQQRRDVRGIEQ